MNLSMFALQGIAATDEADSKAKANRLRSAIQVTLSAAGVDPGGLAQKPETPFDDEDEHRALIVWYDAGANAMRLFAPPIAEIDEITLDALALISGTFAGDLDALPIEDVDAVCRVLTVLGGAENVEELHARFVKPNLHRYEDDFPAPSLDDLHELWENLFPWYIGGSNFAPEPLDAWITRAYAFGAAS